MTDIIKSFTVCGLVLNQSGDPIANKPVVAYDVDLIGAVFYATLKDLEMIQQGGGMQLLGRDTISGAGGSFSIPLRKSSLRRPKWDWRTSLSTRHCNSTVVGRWALSVLSDYKGGTALAGWNVVVEDPGAKGPIIVEHFLNETRAFL